MSNFISDINIDVSAITDEVRRSLVHIHNGRYGAGAGTIWHAAGLIVTNAHVVGHGPVRVELPDGRTLPAQIMAQDTDRDLAALRVEANDLPTIQLGDSRALRPGQWVIALGHPWGVEDAATAGIVMAWAPTGPRRPATAETGFP